MTSIWNPDIIPDPETVLRQDIANVASAIKGAGIVGFSHSNLYAGGTVGAALNMFINVMNSPYNATRNGITNDTAAFDAAYAAAPAGSEIFVPAGNYVCTAPANTKHVRWNASGVTFSGNIAGVLTLPGDVITTSAGRVVISRQTAANDDIGPVLIRRVISNTGGTVGFTPSALQVITLASGTSNNYEWAGLFEMYNSATGVGQNAGSYSKGYSMVAGASQTWGALSEVKDLTGTFGNVIVAHEIDVSANGLVSGVYGVSPQRVGIDIFVRKHNPAGAAVNADYAIRANTEAGSYFKALLRAEGTYTYGVDFSGASVTAVAINLASDQPINFLGSAIRTMFYQAAAAGLTYWNGASILMRIYDSGIIESAGIFNTISGAGEYRIGGTKVVGARITGYSAMTGALNKATVYDTSTVTLPQLAGRVAQLQADLTTHGLIGA